MECSFFEYFLLATFAISIVLTNFASWRMQKCADVDGYTGPKWKLYFGDLYLPNSVLSTRGQMWNKLSVIFFIILLMSAAGIGFENFNGSLCYGVDS